jgi:DNA-3-methyladenine glycosylase II
MTRSFTLRPAPPFRLDLTAWTLRRSAKNGIDRWDGSTYERVLAIGPHAVIVAVRQTHDRLLVVARTDSRVANLEREVAGALGRLLGLHVDLRPFYRMAAQDPRLRTLVAPYRGFRPPRFASVFEAFLNGVSCQQLSLAAGLTVLTRLSARFGVQTAGVDQRACPRPEDLSAARVASLRALGYSGAKVRAILETARAIVHGSLDLEGFSTLDDATALAHLLELRGVGRWTAEYVLLRGFGRLNVFPGDDVGARNGLHRWLGLRQALDYDRVQRLLAGWQPWGGLIYFHMLLSGLDRAGMLTSKRDPAEITA